MLYLMTLLTSQNKRMITVGTDSDLIMSNKGPL